MPYPVSSLIEGRGDPLTVGKEDKIVTALSDMLENDYSQLPVVDNDNHPLGMVTYKSILRAIRNFNAELEDLVVSNAMIDAEDFDLEDDVFDLLKTLQDTNAVLITGAEDKIIGIVTSYDTTEYFRRRSEDMMIVEEIETMIKDLILENYSIDGIVQEEKLQKSVNRIADRIEDLKDKYKESVFKYLSMTSGHANKLDQKAFETSFLKIFEPGKEKSFHHLTLGEYIELLLLDENWDFFKDVFDINPQNIRNVLDEARKTRNDLAHFREIDNNQRENLQFCLDWLNRIHTEYYDGKKEISDEEETNAEVEEEYIAPVGEETTGRTSKYAPLGEYLQGIHGRKDRIRLSFEEIEEIIDDELPPSAFAHRTWWANDSVGHVQSKHWLDAGWKVGYRNMSSHEVTFARIKEREQAYIHFFGPLKSRLEKELDIPFKDSSASGTNWMELIRLPKTGKQLSVITVSFASQDRYRIELYIDTGDKAINKAVFDALKDKKSVIEREVGKPLGWERLSDKRASRIALYNSGSIDDSEKRLEELQDWTVEMLPNFYEALNEKASELLIKKTR